MVVEKFSDPRRAGLVLSGIGIGILLTGFLLASANQNLRGVIIMATSLPGILALYFGFYTWYYGRRDHRLMEEKAAARKEREEAGEPPDPPQAPPAPVSFMPFLYFLLVILGIGGGFVLIAQYLG